MTSVNKSALVPYSAEAMYALVADIERYPEFLPWCGDARIRSREQDTVIASIQIAYKGVHKTFTTRNLLQPGKMMEMRLLDGPFRQLHGFWRFEPLDEDASKVVLDLEFEFDNRLVALAVGPVFEMIANSFVDSFRKRAEALYGSREG